MPSRETVDAAEAAAHLTLRLAALERSLAARDKTIQALVTREKDRAGKRHSTFGAMEENAVLQQVVTQKTLELEVQNRKLEQTTSDLRETSRLLEVLLENTPVYIYFKDEQSRFVHFSQSLQNAVRAADAAALKGKTDFDFFAPAYARETFADEQAILQSGEPIIGKAEKMQHADGRILWTLTTKMPWRNKDGRIIGTFGVSSDLTLIKATQAKLELAQTELLAAARQAGMAEIATNVLHNVGNILNSVNVSADLLGSTLRTSRAQGLSRAVQLMHAHAADLGEFLTLDDKGRLLPGYLGQLALALAAEQHGMAEELARLIRSVDHIKDVVATQQSYAGSSSIVEPVQIRDLAEDALRMNDGSLTRHQVSVVRDFAQTPVLRLDRARVLQILVNLISNAKHAMDGVADRSHRLTLSIHVAGNADGSKNLRVCVSDEGEGISADNLTRIFAHGFTTRKAGHGFGLHSCALAARQMGGTLTAHSEGAGRGATFTLELPIDTAQGAS
ncbi:PAS domain-containing sensor histidine kinase [Polaromonas naphthalenivorans]|uniref:histidine kinase n=1 Tax=Polaromonas naphthalenivorans (strain CJ2) TaxID=365044 RepID=A1VUK9_POLNA|nr:ATP-binding protein [Polaromonas naphthalenivorans]ABM39337.1 PAS/PAC sensor signal transduction histidine kinase [Polaromonas naphthalenivorans CJ2]